MWCQAYSEMRVGKDINNDNDLIEYVRNVLKIREKLKISKQNIKKVKLKS